MSPIARILVSMGSLASIGFGVWHLFVPGVWKWYSYINAEATELVAAVRATNAFFSLSLVLFGLVNLLLIHGERSNRYAVIVVLSATSVLWLIRVAMQLAYPQGTLVPGLQVAMLLAFALVSLCYLVPLLIVARPPNG
ncbi:MAG: hypothetical protein ACYCYF_12815 [Anaerolineae bacterium]